MKKNLLSLTVLLCLCLNVAAQVPEAFKYQAVVRDNGGNALANQTIGMKIRLIPLTPTAQAIYSETFRPNTNPHGLVNLEIGNGTAELGVFATIDWSAGPYFIEVLIDKAGGSNYVSLGVNPLLSVPYALYAKSAGNAFSGDYQDLANKPDLSKFITSPNDADADASNEKIQGIRLNGTLLEITEGGKTYSVDLGTILQTSYNNGHDAGVRVGYDLGYDDGLKDGYNVGYDDGFDDGYNYCIVR